MSEPTKILIADDDDDLVELISMRCKALGLDVITARDAMDALANADFYAPEIAVLDVRMPGGNGISVCEMMATDQRLRASRLIVMTGAPNQLIQQRCENMGVALIKKDQQIWTRLEPIIRAVLKSNGQVASAGQSTGAKLIELSLETEGQEASAEEDSVMSMLDDWGWLNSDSADAGTQVSDAANQDPTQEEDESPWVLAIDDDPDFSVGLQKRLLSHGVRLVRAYRGMDGYRNAFRGRPAAVLLDYHMPDGNGEYVLRRLRESTATDSVPVIVITGMGNASLKRRMLAGGASAFLNKPITWDQLSLVLKQYTDLDLRAPVVPHSHLQSGPPARSINTVPATSS